jgi:hypothetical protein
MCADVSKARFKGDLWFKIKVEDGGCGSVQFGGVVGANTVGRLCEGVCVMSVTTTFERDWLYSLWERYS